MGLFDKFKKKENDDWKNAYMGNPNFYKGKAGKSFGAFTLTENTLTSLPKNPKSLYKIDDTEVDGDEKDNNILIRGLLLIELNEVLK